MIARFRQIWIALGLLHRLGRQAGGKQAGGKQAKGKDSQGKGGIVRP